MIRFLQMLAFLKVRVARLSPYYQFLGFVFTIAIGAKVGVNWWLLMGSIPVFVLALFFETKFGWVAEMDAAWKKSKEWNEWKAKDEQFKAEVRKRLGIG